MYARIVTSYVRPHQLDTMTAVYQEKLLPLLERQPGYRGIFVMNDPEKNKEISITLWEKLVDMEVFNVKLLALKDEIVPLLAKVPDVEICEVVIPDERLPEHVALSEKSLGLRIENPFDRERAG